ncbi:hypothetical protein L596_010655 [Steinernema carpocapsae]|uniref:Uncharacterized protein n=1 Tax=Steinernema carpocapsae TaxID=34508 RepID=A0A4U5PJ95_STECR|nr:hypothetical protein L596_010655 [Steinernema carpocapsae]
MAAWLILPSTLLFLIFRTSLGEGVISNGRQAYVVSSIRQDTTLAEFKELFQYYIEIQMTCQDCIPPTYGLPATFFFGPHTEPLGYSDIKGEALTEALEAFVHNSTEFQEAFITSKSEVTSNVTQKSEHLDRQLEMVLDEAP